jgi:uncharacterized membrane protein
MLATVDAQSVSIFLHVSAVVVGFGSTYALAVTFPVARKAGLQHLPYVHRLGIAVNMWLATPALVVILLTGLYQVDKGNFSLGDAWISASFAILIVLGGLIHGYFLPTDRRLAEMSEREFAGGAAEPSAEYLAAARRTGMVGALAGVLIFAAVFLMVTKPGA